jgi:hypothetical protein
MKNMKEITYEPVLRAMARLKELSADPETRRMAEERENFLRMHEADSKQGVHGDHDQKKEK